LHAKGSKLSAILHQRAVIGALSRSRDPDDPDLVEAKRDLAEAKITAYVEKILAEAPPLNDEQRTRLAELLRPVRKAGAAARGGGDET
jgi:hypothetical protein